MILTKTVAPILQTIRSRIGAGLTITAIERDGADGPIELATGPASAAHKEKKENESLSCNTISNLPFKVARDASMTNLPDTGSWISHAVPLDK